MSKLESLSKFLILTERCSPEVVSEVLGMLDGLGARWGGRTSVYSEKEIVASVLEQGISVNVTVDASGIELSFAREGFYEKNPEYCGDKFISAEYFLFLAEDHLYEKQARGTPK